MNPYEPPVTERRYAPVWSRFRRGVTMAVTEYRRGLRRENISLVQHLSLWFTLFLFALIVLIIIRSFVGLFLELLPNISYYNID